MLHKTLANSLKDVDAAQGIVCAYASSFNVVDDGNDEVKAGAFTKTILEQGPRSKQPRIKFLYQHDTTQILGVPNVLKEDDFGLYFEAKIQPTALGKDVLTLYEAGCITEHSIGYETVLSDWDRSRAVRLLKELRLFEFSAVTFGMNPETPTVAVKSLTDPTRLSALATKAAKLDSLLHNGTLRSDVLCETLERELKALQTALAPTRSDATSASHPYNIGRLVDDMDDLAGRLGLGTKAASDDDKKAQEARAKKYGIGIKDGGNVTKPGQWKDLDDADFGDPTNYKLPMPDKAHADNAASRFGQEATRGQYTKPEQAIIDKRIAAAQKKFGEDDSGKAAQTTMLQKGSGGDIEVAADGTHGAYTGTHRHKHSAMGSQGEDDNHNHSHSHGDDASHDHSHEPGPSVTAGRTAPTAHTHPHTQTPQVRKARDFGTLFASMSAGDQLQDDWGDTFIAFTQCISELMWQATAQNNGWTPVGADTVDIQDAVQQNLNAFGDAVMDLVTRSIAADFVPEMTCDRDQFIDPDGPNAESDGYEDSDGWKSRNGQGNPLAMPEPPAMLAKAGRAISGANRKLITEALDGMAMHMKGMKAHHGAIADLMKKTDPDAVRQDEDQALGDDDTAHGGTDPQKAASRQPLTPRRTAAGSPPQAGTTQPGDTTALLADLDSVLGRFRHEAGKA